MAIIIGLGHKARMGKDFVAKYIAENNEHTYIVHWADQLYEEVRNNSIFPLITYDNSCDMYFILDKPLNEVSATYTSVVDEEVPFLDKLFKDRNITFYDRMIEKDSPILQFWGTDFRRRFFGNSYWVDKCKDKINEISRLDHKAVILIPDTRFKNELMALKEMSGYYIDVIRYNEDGTRFFAPDRDPNHQSECDLDGVQFDYVIKAVSGDLDALYGQATDIFNDIMDKYKHLHEAVCDTD